MPLSVYQVAGTNYQICILDPKLWTVRTNYLMGGWVAGWLAGWQAVLPGAWLAGSLAGWLAGGLAGVMHMSAD